ncbi:MAG: phosphotransferase family protein [Pseudomonadales bacterium]|nr:phosphotransferase family protein [Pseudomonadales bacterium]
MTTESINLQNLEHYLHSRLPDYPGPTSLEKFNSGQSNPTYLLQSGQHHYVLRRKPPGVLLASAHAVDREFRLLSALHGSTVPVARPWLLCRDEAVIGSMFYLMSYEPGDIFWDPALPEISKHQRQDYYHALIDTLAALHDLDYVALGLQDFGKPGSYYERQLTRWTAQYEASATHEIPAMNQLITWLHQALPADDGQCSLIHGDYRLDNVIFHPGEARIKAVLDWELATLGHPLADLAYYCMALRLPGNDQIRGLGGQHRTALGIPEEEALIQRYCTARGLDQVSHWEFCMAFSFFRLAAILQGVYKRGLDGNASNERAIRMGGMVEPLAEMAIASL